MHNLDNPLPTFTDNSSWHQEVGHWFFKGFGNSQKNGRIHYLTDREIDAIIAIPFRTEYHSYSVGMSRMSTNLLCTDMISSSP